ncbi:MAG: MBL fold metallo-hydrolase [Bacteroidia bacterium]
MKSLAVCLGIFFFLSCKESPEKLSETSANPEVFLMVLGNVQDAGSPQAGCRETCCSGLWEHPDPTRMVSSLGLIDQKEKQFWMFDATPDFSKQWLLAQNASTEKLSLRGIILTHAHIGHYTGIMQLGKEALNSDSIPVYGFPRMRAFLSENGPWEALVANRNILLLPLSVQQPQKLSEQLSVQSVLVPHRDEYSETAAFIIHSKTKRALYIPDIDKWDLWEYNIDSLIATVDYAFLDGTFYDAEEINHRDIRSIPHPFIIESMERFKNLSPELKSRIYFTHFNHTNPALDVHSAATKAIEAAGFHVARTGMVFSMD